MVEDSKQVTKIIESFEPFTQFPLISDIFDNVVSKPGIWLWYNTVN